MDEYLTLFSKDMDKSVLTDGFAIPKDAHYTLKECGSFPERGECRDAKVQIGESMYSVRLVNIAFSGAHANHSTVIQIRYSKTSDFCLALRELFNISCRYIMEQRSNPDYENRKQIALPNDKREYMVLKASKTTPNLFLLESHLAVSGESTETINTIVVNDDFAIPQNLTYNNRQNTDIMITIELRHGNDAKYSFEGKRIIKLNSSISPQTAVELIRVVDNQINPREAKAGPITKAIFSTLNDTPELFWFKSKGILLATTDCEILQDPNQVSLTFGNPLYEGIMDGGHNFLAIANFLTTKLLKKPLKNWKECKQFWAEHYDEIKRAIDEEAVKDDNILSFSIPIEIIAPMHEEGALDDYYRVISAICKARNNNVQLQDAALSNQSGFYDYLKEQMTDFPVQWKTNDAGTIKVNDVVSWATLPLMFLQQKDLIVKEPKLNVVSIYSSKSKCVNAFSAILDTDGYCEEENGKFKLTSELIKSALNLVPDILRYFDRLTVAFPDLFKKALHSNLSTAAGDIIDKNKQMEVPFKTTDSKSSCSYPLAYIYPLVAGTTALMRVNGNKVEWIKNPADPAFDLNNVNLSTFVSVMKSLRYDPQKVGKDKSFYELGVQAYNAIV